MPSRNTGRAAPTEEAYAELQQAFDHFNAVLFGAQLNQPIFTLQREKRFLGFCSKQRFVSRVNGVMVDEIAMNPTYFAVRPIRDTLSTLVHEMCHSWQFHYGKPGRRGYHNKEWGDKMKAVGLHPSHTGRPGGKETGEKMTHYIIQGGAFDDACKALLTTAFTLSWLDRFPVQPASTTITISPIGMDDEDREPEGVEAEPPASVPGVLPPAAPTDNRTNRIKYQCQTCQRQVWGKPNLKIGCMEHEAPEMMLAMDA